MNARATRAAAAGLLAALLLAAPGLAAEARAPARRPNAAAADAMAACVAAAPEDRPAIASGIEALLDFIAMRRGADAARAAASMRTPAELPSFLAGKLGTTVFEEAFDAAAAWEKAEGPIAWDAGKAARLETEHFVVVSMPGSAAHRDRDYVARFLERLVVDIGRLIAPNGAARSRLERNLGSARSMKVEIALSCSAGDFGKAGRSGEITYGLTVANRALVPTASIRMPYYNALSTAALAPEIAHLVDIYCKFDSGGAPPLPEEGLMGPEADRMRQDVAKWAQAAFERIIPNGTGLGEGFGEYVADRTCPLRAALYGEPEARLAVARKRIGLDRDVLERRAPPADRVAKAVLEIERDSFVSFLVERYGYSRFLDLYMAVPLTEKRFKEAYGKGFREAQAEWRSSLGS